MDYHGTNNDDDIDQAKLGLPDWSNIYGEGGNDTIRIGNATAIGGPGNDTLIGTTPYSTVAYWGSPSAVTVNLATGVAQDGYGGLDHLFGIRIVQDSAYSDTLIGSQTDETFWLSGGNNSVDSGGGHDTVIYYGVRGADAVVTYDAPTDTFTVRKHFANGDNGTDTLKGVSQISFTGPGSDNASFTKDMFVAVGGFQRSQETTLSPDMNKVAQIRIGDFNGDGHPDLLVSRINWSDVGVTPMSLQVLLGDGSGHLVDATSTVFQGGTANVHYVPRIFATDFNKDGISDIFAPDFGVDGPPFPGGQNSLFLSSPTTHQLASATATLPQALRQNHGTSVGDVNGDGYPDILVNALNENTGHANDLLINDGTGHFVSSPQKLPASVTGSGYDPGNTWSLLADLNGDGYADMVLGTWDASTKPSQVFLNDGHGSFADSVPVALPRSGVDKEIVVGIETIDLNGDSLPDLVLSITNGGDRASFYQVPYLQLLVNDGNGAFHDETQARLPQSKTVVPGANPDWYLSTRVVDLNHDGFQDLVVDDAGMGHSKVLMNDGHGNFHETWVSGVGTHVAVADVDGDGMPDLITSDSVGFSVLYNKMPNGHIYRTALGGDQILASSANDTIFSGAGSNSIDGGGGVDTVVYQGGRTAAVTVDQAGAGYLVHGKDAIKGTDTLLNVERLKFDDGAIALDIGGMAGQAYRLYQAAFDRAPDQGGLGYWIAQRDAGMGYVETAARFIDSNEFRSLYGQATTTSAFVDAVYRNVLHRAPDDDGRAFYIGQIDSGSKSMAQVLADFSESPENQTQVIGQIQHGIAYTPW